MSERKPAAVFPPGAFIKEEIDARGWTQEDLARILGKPFPTVNQILNGKRAIIAETAMRLAAAFGNSPQFWMNLEATWQLHRQGETLDADRVRSRARLYDLAPVREMAKRGWLKKTKTSKELEVELKRFFDVQSLDDVPNLAAAARASTQDEHGGMTSSQWTWCCRAIQLARMVEAKRFSRSKLSGIVDALRPFMCDPEEVRHVPKVLSSAGIRLVIVEHLSRTRIDGAALWPSESSPVIAMSLRYGRIDHFWFTLMHELAHICNRDGGRADIDILQQSEDLDDAEEKANEQAAAWLVSPKKLESFILRTTPLYSTQGIQNFAKRMGIHPGIVVGQLKFRDELDWGRFSRLQQIDVRAVVQQAAMCDGWGRIAPVSQ